MEPTLSGLITFPNVQVPRCGGHVSDFAHQEMHIQDRAFYGQELAPGLCRWCDGSDKSAQEIKADANTMENILPQPSPKSLHKQHPR